jgi:frataxin-like iron-binding protein CyaY
MKISDLIKELEHIKNRFGDLNMTIDQNFEFNPGVKRITIKKNNELVINLTPDYCECPKYDIWIYEEE